jgi:hypothetical protein
MSADLTPSPEQIALAWRQLRRPSVWPASVEAALAHPVYGTCLRAMARQMARPVWQSAPVLSTLPRAGLPPVPATPTAPPPRTKAAAAKPHPDLPEWRHRGIDLKRAAANDRDD